MKGIAPALQILGGGFDRPESVHWLGNGDIAASHRGVGVRILHPDGSATLLGRLGQQEDDAGDFLPNGVLPEPDGTYLLANIGPRGGLWRASPDGLDEMLLDTEVPPLNFVTRDPSGRLWATVSTQSVPRSDAYHANEADGLLLRLHEPTPGLVTEERREIRVRVVADRLHYPNEIGFSPDGRTLYVNETMAFRTSAFSVIGPRLGERRTYARYEGGDFCDGLTVDTHGCLWVTCIVSNRLYVVSPSRTPTLVLDDGDPSFTTSARAAYDRAAMGRTWFDNPPPGARVPQMSSVSFSHDGHLAVLGCLLGESLYVFELR